MRRQLLQSFVFGVQVGELLELLLQRAIFLAQLRFSLMFDEQKRPRRRQKQQGDSGYDFRNIHRFEDAALPCRMPPCVEPTYVCSQIRADLSSMWGKR